MQYLFYYSKKEKSTMDKFKSKADDLKVGYGYVIIELIKLWIQGRVKINDPSGSKK